FTWENAKNSRIVTDQNKLVIQKAILCCRNVHARRSLMYYQKSFPEAKIFVSPSVIGNITKENWYTTKDGIDAVNAEISRILYQFSLLV
ncbi:MAG: YdcF family protein, partial [Lachnospiraceae bacterium]